MWKKASKSAENSPDVCDSYSHVEVEMEAKVREDSPANVVESKPSCSKVRVIRSTQKLQNSCGLNQESSKPERAAVGYKLINAPLLGDSIALLSSNL